MYPFRFLVCCVHQTLQVRVRLRGVKGQSSSLTKKCKTNDCSKCLIVPSPRRQSSTDSYHAREIFEHVVWFVHCVRSLRKSHDPTHLHLCVSKVSCE